eukprot:241849_1
MYPEATKLCNDESEIQSIESRQLLESVRLAVKYDGIERKLNDMIKDLDIIKKYAILLVPGISKIDAEIDTNVECNLDYAPQCSIILTDENNYSENIKKANIELDKIISYSQKYGIELKEPDDSGGITHECNINKDEEKELKIFVENG